MNISEVTVQSGDGDKCLTTPAVDVNIRLYKTNDDYRSLITHAIDYIIKTLKQDYTDYTNPRGISAVEIGVPWNIIAYKDNINVKVCINPKIVSRSKATTTSKTKCPSSPNDTYSVERHDHIDITFFDLNGRRINQKNITRYQGGWCIQHEINHNRGITPATEGRLEPHLSSVAKGSTTSTNSVATLTCRYCDKIIIGEAVMTKNGSWVCAVPCKALWEKIGS